MIKTLLKQENVIILFSAPWCAFCNPIDTLLNKLLDDEDDIHYAKLSVTEHGNFARSLGVASLPNVTFFHGGEPVLNMIGAKPHMEYKSKITWLREL